MNFIAGALGERKGGDLGRRSTSLPDLRERLPSLPRVGSWGWGSADEPRAALDSEGAWEEAARGGNWPTVVGDEPKPSSPEGSWPTVVGDELSMRYADDVQAIAAEELRFALEMERARCRQDENAAKLRQLQESAKLQEEEDAARLRHR